MILTLLKTITVKAGAWFGCVLLCVTKTRLFFLALFFSMGVCLSACDQSVNVLKNGTDEKNIQMNNSANSSSQTITAMNSPVLARVDSEVIRQSDIDFMLEKTFASIDPLLINDTLESKVLESLIAAKAMKHHVIEQMSEQETFALQQKVKAYEEELYIKEYLSRNAIPEPVTTTMVESYYQANPEQFGGGEEKLFEMIKLKLPGGETGRDAVMSQISLIKQNESWSKLVNNELSKWGAKYAKSTMRPGLLNKPLEEKIKALAAGKTSNGIVLDNYLYVLRVLKAKDLTAQPLSAVSTAIRKKLAAIQLKKAVKKQTEDVLKLAIVEREVEREVE